MVAFLSSAGPFSLAYSKTSHGSFRKFGAHRKADEYVDRILEILPDEDRNNLYVLVRTAMPKHDKAVVEHVVDTLLSSHQGDSKDESLIHTNAEDENLVECGCCFASYPFEEMVQCPETHLFCTSCMKSHASILIGSHNPDIRCVDQSGCTAEISSSELRRILPPKTMELWERVRQRRDLEAAGLENLQYCPFCDWGCIIEDEVGQVLMCRNKRVCGVASCRWCKKLDHRPNLCEVDSSGKHHVEEAMSGALVRQCPGCKKPFIKEAGCNKMKCPSSSCGIYSCYICRQIIQGYDHFSQREDNKGGDASTKTRCLLWDVVEERHTEDVRVAAEIALKEYYREKAKSGVNNSVNVK